MSDVDDLIDALVGGGMSHSDASAMVARVVTHASRCVTVVTLTSRDASRSVTQEQSRLRAKNYRNRKKSQQVAKANDVATAGETVTLPAVTRHVTPIEGPLLTSSFLLPLEPKKEVVARARGSRLKPGALLTQEFIDAAIEAGAHREAIPKIWTEFVDYWSDIPGQRGCKISWLGTWRNNVKRVGTGNWSGQKNGRRTVHDAAKDFHENLLDRIAAFDEPAPSGLCGGEGAGVVRLLPPRRRE